MSAWWNSPTASRGDVRLPRRASSTPPGWRWFPDYASGSCAACRCWSGVVPWVHGLLAAPLPSQMRSPWCAWPSHCSRPAARGRLRRRAVFRNWTGLRFRLLSCKEPATRSGSRLPTAGAWWSRCRATTALRPIYRRCRRPCGPGLPISLPSSNHERRRRGAPDWTGRRVMRLASGRGGDRARAVLSRSSPAPSRAPAASAPSAAAPAALPLSPLRASSLPRPGVPGRRRHPAWLGRERVACQALRS